MREVKFRGLDMFTNKWVYGLPYREGEWLNIQMKNGISVIVDDESIGEFAFKLKLLDGETELFEGDVIENIVGNKKYVIEWDADYGTFFFVELDGKSEGTVAFEFIENCEHENCYLFGNITENPELLKGVHN